MSLQAPEVAWDGGETDWSWQAERPCSKPVSQGRWVLPVSAHNVQQQVKLATEKEKMRFSFLNDAKLGVFWSPGTCHLTACLLTFKEQSSYFLKALISLAMPQGSFVQRFFVFWASGRMRNTAGVLYSKRWKGGIARAFKRKNEDFEITKVGSEDWLVGFSSLLLSLIISLYKYLS